MMNFEDRLASAAAPPQDAPYLLEPMIDGFMEEPSGAVQLEMLTATAAWPVGFFVFKEICLTI